MPALSKENFFFFPLGDPVSLAPQREFRVLLWGPRAAKADSGCTNPDTHQGSAWWSGVGWVS